jgi:hypothetical protein
MIINLKLMLDFRAKRIIYKSQSSCKLFREIVWRVTHLSRQTFIYFNKYERDNKLLQEIVHVEPRNFFSVELVVVCMLYTSKIDNIVLLFTEQYCRNANECLK